MRSVHNEKLIIKDIPIGLLSSVRPIRVSGPELICASRQSDIASGNTAAELQCHLASRDKGAL